MANKHIKTVADLIRDLGDYPPDAVVASSVIKVETPTCRSTMTYSQREATKMMQAREAQCQ